MPELPEIEHLKRTLEPALLGGHVKGVTLGRADVVHAGRTTKRVTHNELLADCTISSLARHGKQLAVLTREGPALCFHLGMSGQLLYVSHGKKLARSDHVHCRWRIDGPAGHGRLVFRDPRRFGGIWTFASSTALLEQRWCRLGPDAMTITVARLRPVLAGANRPIKAALLDQHVLAGVGNIYADEALFAAGIHPLAVASQLSAKQVTTLASSIRATLRRAVAAGGSTLRDYADGNGQAGWFVTEHRVYGRAGEPCFRCRKTLARMSVAQRTTVYCPNCQPFDGV